MNRAFRTSFLMQVHPSWATRVITILLLATAMGSPAVSRALTTEADNFQRANGAVGANWAGTGTGNVSILNNTLDCSTSPSSQLSIYWNANSNGADQYSQVTVGATVSTTTFGPAVRVQSGGSRYRFVWWSGSYYLQYMPGTGNGTNLQIVSASTPSVGTVLTLSVSGTTLNAYVNGALTLHASDSNLSSGQPGIDVGFGMPVGNATSGWSGGDLGAQPYTEADNFQRANGPIGSNWAGTGAGNVSILNNTLDCSTSPSSQLSIYWSANTNGGAQYSQVTVGASVSTTTFGPAVRVQSGGSRYRFVWWSGSYYLQYMPGTSNGTNLQIVSASMPGVGTVLTLSVSGTTLNAYVNGALTLTASDSNLSSGQPGIDVGYGMPVGNATSGWSGGDLGIVVTPASATVPAGLPQKFAAQERHSDGTAQDVTSSVTWSSTSPSVATVNSAGQANGLAVGSTTIQASLGSLTGSAALIVQSPLLTGVLVQPALGGTIVGGTQQFSATGVFSDGSTQNLTASVSWSSSATNIATINANGLSTGIGNGRTVITAISGGVTGSASLNVATAATPPSISASVSPSPNVNGWNNTNVTVTFNCGAGSAAIVNCPGPQAISSEGTGQIISGTVTDAAGNVATASVTLNIDKTLPTITVTAPPEGAAFSASPITATGTVSDATSGVSTVTCNGTAAAVSSGNFSCNISLNPGLNLITVRAFDVAGNVAGVNLHASLAAALSAPASLQVSPNNVSMLVGSDQSFSATDDQGRLRNDVTWSVSDATIASLAADGSGTLTGVAPGQVTLTASLQGISGQTTVNVLSGTSFPLGTVLWSAPAIGGYNVWQTVQALPVSSSPDLYSVEYSTQAHNLLIRALTAGGQELWRSSLGAICSGSATPDRNGGVIVAFEPGTWPSCGSVTLVDLDSQTGSSVWSYSDNIYGFNVAIGADGNVWLNDASRSAIPLLTNDGNCCTYWVPTLAALDGNTGVRVFSYTPPNGAVTDVPCHGGTTVFPTASALGNPSVGPDGTVYAGLVSRNDVSWGVGGGCAQTYAPNETLSLVAVPPGGSATVTPFYAVTSLLPDGSIPFPFVGGVIPDGYGGTLASWGIPIRYDGPYQTHVAHGPADLILPSLNTYAPQMVLGESQTVFATDGYNVVSFNTSGALGWSWSNPDVNGLVNLIAATYDGGLVAKNTDRGADTVVRFDVNGTPTDDSGIGTFSGLDYFVAGSSFVGFPSAGPPTAYSAAPVELSSSGWYAPQGEGGQASVQNLTVTNASSDGPNQATIASVFGKLKSALDADAASARPTCSNWVQASGVTGSTMIQTLLTGSDPAHPVNNFGHGTFSINIYGAVSGLKNRDGSLIGVPTNFAITVNDNGGFFKTKDSKGNTFLVGKREYSGGTLRAQATILLHELGHVMPLAGFQADLGDLKAGKANDTLVDQNCRTLIEGLQ